MTRIFLVLCFPVLLLAQDTDWWDKSKTEFSISTAEQLKGLAKLVNDGTTNFSRKTISLSNDIVLTENFIPIGKDSIFPSSMFLGTFDGNGYSISGLSVENQRAAGLFGFTFGNIKNLTVNASKIKASDNKRTYAGVLAGVHGYGASNSIENCYVTADSVVATSSENALAGGLVGLGTAKILNSYFIGTISTSANSGISGGLAGAGVGIIEYSRFIGNVSATGKTSVNAGGLVGYGGDITYTGDNISELRARSKITISNSYSIGDVLATASEGALSGGLTGTVFGATEISKSYHIGNISAKANTSTVASGGLVAMVFPMFGGPVNISNSYSIGDVSAISDSKDPLVGYMSYSGGFIGYTYGISTNIANSYTSGEISGNGNFGGIFGVYSGGTITSTYYNLEGADQAAGTGSPAGIKAKSTDELKLKETFIGWDFDEVWEIHEADAMPFLNFWYSISGDIEYFKILDQTYTGSQIKPQPIIQKKDGTRLIKGVDYELNFGENKNAGEGTIIVTGKNAYLGMSKVIAFKINKKELTSYAIGSIAIQDYTGFAIEPVIIVKDNNNVLILGTDYTVAYSNNVKAGKATVTVNGIGNYSGQTSSNFAIIGGESSSSSVEASSSSSDSSVPIFSSQVIKTNSIFATQNSIELQVLNSANLAIYDLNGKLEKILHFKKGTYNISLNDLPKGVYIVKTIFSNERRILKVLIM